MKHPLKFVQERGLLAEALGIDPKHSVQIEKLVEHSLASGHNMRQLFEARRTRYLRRVVGELSLHLWLVGRKAAARMTEHFTRSTVSSAFWCGKCNRSTQHRIDDKRKGPCLECIDRLEKQHADSAKTEPPRQQVLFG